MAKKNPFKDNLYGTYEGPRGNASEWRKVFEERLDPDEAQRIVKEDSPWSILGIRADASIREIKTAYRRLAMELHPDKHPESKQQWAHEEFIKVKAAYTILIGVA